MPEYIPGPAPGEPHPPADVPPELAWLPDAPAAAAPRVGPTPPASRAVLDFSESHRVAGLPPARRLVFGLLARTLVEYRSEPLMVVLSLLIVPFFAAAGALGGALVMAAGYWLLVGVGRWAGPGANAALYVIPLLVFAFARGMQWIAEDHEIGLRTERGRADGLRLGRLHDIFTTAEPGTLGMFLGAAVGLQLGLLFYTSGHAGLPIKGTLGECALLTLDNACHGIPVEKLGLGRAYWSRRPEPSFWSENILYAFRIATDAFALLIVYGAYRRHQLRRIFRGFPRDPRRPGELLDWLDACGRVEPGRTRAYFEEFLFLAIARDFLRGDDDSARRLADRLPWLKLAPEVRALFTRPDGAALFPGPPRGG